MKHIAISDVRLREIREALAKDVTNQQLVDFLDKAIKASDEVVFPADLGLPPVLRVGPTEQSRR